MGYMCFVKVNGIGENALIKSSQATHRQAEGHNQCIATHPLTSQNKANTYLITIIQWHPTFSM